MTKFWIAFDVTSKYRLTQRIVIFSALVASGGIRDRAAALPPAYVITELGTLGGNNSLGWSINARGQVTGYAGTPGIVDEPFLWTPNVPNVASGTMNNLETLGGQYSWGIGINDSGQVAGVSATVGDAAEHATLWTPTTPNSAIGTLHDLQTLGGTYSQGNGVNASGQVAGYSDLTGDTNGHAFMWKPTTPGEASGTMHDLGTLGGTYSIGWDINSSGRITGDSDMTDDVATNPFLWKPTVPNSASGTMYDLGTFGGSWGSGSGINVSGQVAGSAFNQDEAARAFLWTPTIPGGTSGAMLDLGTLGGSDSYGLSVNTAGQVVGLSYVPADVSNYSHAFLYTPGSGLIDLNTRIDPLSGWELFDSYDINDAGQITGQGLIDDEYHAFLLTPVHIPGDFNNNGVVDAADYVVWRKTDGTPAGYNAWRTHFGEPSGSGAAVSSAELLSTVPEPAALALLMFAAAGFSFPRRRVA